MRSQTTTAVDVLPARRPTPERDPNAALQRELAQSRAMCRRHEMSIKALTHAVGVLRRGATALTDENRDLRAQIARNRGRARA